MVLLVSLTTMPSAQAADLNFTGGGPSTATNRSTVIISAKAPSSRRGPNNGGGQAVVHYMNVTSDLATATIKFYRTGAPVKVTTASGSTTNVLGLTAADAAAFTTTNQIIVVRHVATDVYERAVNLTPTGNTVKFVPATAATVAAGDLVYVCTLIGPGLPVNSIAGKEFISSEGIACGEPGEPLLIELDGTSVCKLHVAGKYRMTE